MYLVLAATRPRRVTSIKGGNKREKRRERRAIDHISMKRRASFYDYEGEVEFKEDAIACGANRTECSGVS